MISRANYDTKSHGDGKGMQYHSRGPSGSASETIGSRKLSATRLSLELDVPSARNSGSICKVSLILQ
jgi:hypothetical protein